MLNGCLPRLPFCGVFSCDKDTERLGVQAMCMHFFAAVAEVIVTRDKKAVEQTYPLLRRVP